MPAADPPPSSPENRVPDSNDIYDADALARELMMPTGEPVAAVIGACLLLGMIWFASGHAVGSHSAHPAARGRPFRRLTPMGILLAYFVWVVSTLAVIATVWIGVADSGVDRLHLQRATAMQRSFDASVMAENDTATAATKAKPDVPHAVTGPRRAAPRLSRRQRRNFDPRLALRANPPLFDGN